MGNVSILSVDAEEASAQSADIARVYANVFASPPWNEAYKCTTCGNSFDAKRGNEQCCGSQVREYYPLAETSEDIRKSFALTRARVALALADESSIVGFAWGWQDTLGTLNDERFRLPAEAFDRLVAQSGFDPNDDVFYFSEFGVRSELRGQGIGRTMLQKLFSSVDVDSAKGLVMRTSKKSPAYSIVTDPRNGSIFSVSHEYRDVLERVILSRPNQ